MHGSFCKGLIVYREAPELLPYDNEYLVFNFGYEAKLGVRDFSGYWDRLSIYANDDDALYDKTWADRT